MGVGGGFSMIDGTFSSTGSLLVGMGVDKSSGMV
jgi:hypothetical protein